jgi:photosystem II stability/assembly factor-like uncharacterized protein
MNKRLYIVITYIILFFTLSELNAQESRSFSWLHPKPQGQSIRNIFTLDSEKWYGVTMAGDFIRTTNSGFSWEIVENVTGINVVSGSSNSLNDIHMFDDKTGIVCGSEGILSRTTNGGKTWSSYFHPDRTQTWYDLFFIDDKTGFVCGEAGNGIQITTNAGISWNRINTPNVDALSFYALNEGTYYFSSLNGKVYSSENGGNSWSECYTGTNDTLWKINFLNKQTAVVCGTSNAVKVSFDKGLTWNSFSQNLPSNSWYDIDFQTDNTLQPVSESFGNETFPPTGWANLKYSGISMWERSTISPYLSPACVWSNYDATGGDNVLMTPEIEVVRDDRLIFYMRRSYTGTIFNWDSLQVYALPSGGNTTRNWIPLMKLGLNIADTAASNYPPRIGSYKRYEVHLGKLNGQKVRLVFRHKNTDGTGVRLDEILAGSYRSNSVTKIYLTGNSSNVYSNIIDPIVHLDQPWLPISFINPTQIYKGTMLSTSVIGEDSLVISGVNGNINRSYPFQGNAAYSDRTTGNNLYDIWANEEGELIISVGSSGNVLTSSNSGTSWNYSKISENSLYSISMIDDKQGWISGADGFLYRTTDGGNSWDKSVSHKTINILYGDFYEVNFFDRMTGWAFDEYGRIIKTINGGKKWHQQSSGLPHEIKINDSYIVDHNTCYYVGALGSIGKTTNGGEDWFDISFSDEDLNSIEMINSLTGWVCGKNGTLLKTINGGKSWEKIIIPYQNTNLECIKFIDEYNGMIAGSSGKTFRTNDGGISWTFENSGATDHFAIHLLNNKTAYISSSFGNIVKYIEKQTGKRNNIAEQNSTPSDIILYQNYPNPFNPSTVIRFTLPFQSVVSLKVYDISGKEVASLFNGETLPQGLHSANFSAKHLSSGVYIYNLLIDGNIKATRKMLLIK